jgi:hypothetical protein
VLFSDLSLKCCYKFCAFYNPVNFITQVDLFEFNYHCLNYIKFYFSAGLCCFYGDVSHHSLFNTWLFPHTSIILHNAHMCSFEIMLSCTYTGEFFLSLLSPIMDDFVNNICCDGLHLYFEAFCPHCCKLLVFAFDFSSIFAATCTGRLFFPRLCVEPVEFYIYFTACMVCSHIIDCISLIYLPVLISTRWAECIHNAL